MQHQLHNLSPTTELEAVNCMLSAIGESPVSSLQQVTTDVSVALSVLTDVSKEIQLEGFYWNTEDDYPLVPNGEGRIKVHPSIIRVVFKAHQNEDIVLRGSELYDRKNHTYNFPTTKTIKVTVTMFLSFDKLPEAARRYIILRALRIYQERVVGSQVLSQFHATDEARARSLLMAEERHQERPNLLTGTRPAINVWGGYYG